MTKRSREFEPQRVQKGSSRARRFFSFFGITSARAKREKDDDTDE